MDLQKQLNERQEDLSKREFECKSVENVKNMKEEAEALLDSANTRLHQAVEAERALRQATQEETEKLNEKRLECQKEASAVLVQRKRIDEEVSRRVNKILTDMGIRTNPYLINQPGEANAATS